MGYFLLFLMVAFGLVIGWGKISANFAGERLCMFCHKRLKYAGAGHYAEVCPRCGRTQTNRG